MTTLLAWIPPAALAERALGPDVGGGRPSLIVETEEPTGDRVWRYTGRWEPLDSAIRDWDSDPGHVALLLSLDGAPCRLSLMRVGDLTGVLQTHPIEQVVARLLKLGGEIVEVKS